MQVKLDQADPDPALPFVPVPTFRHQILKSETKAEINHSLMLSFRQFRGGGGGGGGSAWAGESYDGESIDSSRLSMGTASRRY